MNSSNNHRAEGLVNSAIFGLQEYYECLNDTTLAKEFASAITVPNTGNDQKDYETVRDAVERLAKAHENDRTTSDGELS